MRHVRKTPLHKHCKQANGPRSNTRCVLTIIPDLISGAKRADHRIRGPDAHTKNDFDEYDGFNMAGSNFHHFRSMTMKKAWHSINFRRS
jgi:hypothetical protein